MKDIGADKGTETADLRFQDKAPRIHSTARLKGTKLGPYSEIGERVQLTDVNLGAFSYFERNGEAIYADIGKFCSIAANVRINALEHPMERLSTHKFSYRPNEYFRFLPLDSEFRARRQNKRVSIGHDVWIGHGAVIMPDIKIGHGAVIGANAVVTKDVGDYEIVVGVPAKNIKMRFSKPIVESLLALQWWDWPLEKLYEAIPDMQNMAIEDFISKWQP
ncbi:antibiotic acetyltransferase [Bartonella sp. HY329]|uniref:DapH/DapD/GlmU-related protein n=1 Tax=unclassified Bartonella TaxID=2645622 RepID=UPI0021C8972A|nr:MULTISPECIES: DapH/DapD/GlmU-related protein [unclassified Bartonella]UXM94515.1 antibiotic acetyltransferase [Bartonella sp. HY329]UXN08839.1 antibiotic acetyltransferase [Bartonella sp. HY328]